jgi:GDP-4-dehydro-6-deoxy-D-mannose reductase
MNKILITGAQGFLGSVLRQRCTLAGNAVLGLGAEEGDIADSSTCRRYNEEAVSHVFHLAAKTFVPDSWTKPMDFYRTNVMGTENVLEFCRRKNVPLTYVSAFVYGNPSSLPIAEEHPVVPNNPYAHSKYLAEQLCEFYSAHYQVKITVIRPFNIYGAGQAGRFLIPHVVRQVLHEDVIKVKDLRPKRDYVYVDDVADALMLTLGPSAAYSVYNIASGGSLSVQEIIDIVQQAANTNKPVEEEAVVRPNELFDVFADITRARQGLNWRPKHTFREGIAKLIQHEIKGDHTR